MEVIVPLLSIDDLHVRLADPDADAGNQVAHGETLRGLDLTVRAGELHAIMGPIGSGVSTLGATLMGSPQYEVTSGSIMFQGDDVTDWPVDERSKAGMFLAFQDPQEIPGVSVLQLLRRALSTRQGIDLSMSELHLATTDWTKRLGLDSSVLDRPLAGSFSSQEQRGLEMLQLAILEPELALLDVQTDLDHPDLGALRMVAAGIREACSDREPFGVVLITNDHQLIDELQPDHVHILVDGCIVSSAAPELAEQIEHNGHDSFLTVAAA